MRMREPVLTPEQSAAARRAAVLEREKLHAGAEDRRAIMLKVMGLGPVLMITQWLACKCMRTQAVGPYGCNTERAQ